MCLDVLKLVLAFINGLKKFDPNNNFADDSLLQTASREFCLWWCSVVFTSGFDNFHNQSRKQLTEIIHHLQNANPSRTA